MASYAEGQKRRKRTAELRVAVVEAARHYFREPMSRMRLEELETALRVLDEWEASVERLARLELNKYCRNYYQQHIAAGLCARCSKKAVKGQVLCKKHAKKLRSRVVDGERLYHCSKCGVLGHNARRCRREIHGEELPVFRLARLGGPQ
jgi:hypothetical protein